MLGLNVPKCFCDMRLKTFLIKMFLIPVTSCWGGKLFHPENDWFTDTIEYYNSKLKEYKVTFLIGFIRVSFT